MPGNERYRAPGVYTSEVPVGGEPLQPAGSSAAAMIGTAGWGPMGAYTFISSWTNFVRKFGNDGGYLAQGARNFFRMGGTRLYVVRTCHYEDLTSPISATAVKSEIVVMSNEATPAELFTVTALYPGTFGDNLVARMEDVDAEGETFSLEIYQEVGDKLALLESYRSLSLDDESAQFAEDVINARSKYIEIEVAGDSVEHLADDTEWDLTGGDDGLAEINDEDYVGDDAGSTGLYALDTVPELLTILHPGITSNSVIVDGQQYVRDSVDRRGCDIYIFDLPVGYDPQEALDFVGNELMSTSYEACYFPWGVEGSATVPMAPFMAGVYAKNDFEYGVWCAPAGTKYSLPLTDLMYDLSFGDIQLLNPYGINCIRRLFMEGFVPWGVRTLEVNSHFRYLNVRRFVNVIKKTLQSGANQFVFELNGPALWVRIEDTARMLMMFFHSLGAFAGATPAKSFYCKCDEETNPPELIDQGIVTCVIGICPAKPAEFVEFEIRLYNHGVLPIATTPGE